MTKKAKSEPSAVLISDVHFSIATLSRAKAALQMAIDKANELTVPVFVLGDLHDTKANMRAECVKAMLDVANTCATHLSIIVGNHDKINEKSSFSEHSLHFLREAGFFILDQPAAFQNYAFIPYCSTSEKFLKNLAEVPNNYTILAHQGLKSAAAGEYFQDHSAVPIEALAGRKVISGHYHTSQTIPLPEGGSWTYLGNPYTLNFGEAGDPPKGFKVLMEDGTLEHIRCDLPKHVILDLHFFGETYGVSHNYTTIKPNDLVLIKAHGTAKELQKVTQKWVKEELELSASSRIELNRVDDGQTAPPVLHNNPKQTLDSIIDLLENHTNDDKARLKTLLKSLLEL